MAKIGAKPRAGGERDREVARWRAGELAEPGAPHELVLTAHGRLLHKPLRDDGWKLRERRSSITRARNLAVHFGMERVT
jgi:hypothetical protein